MGSLYRRGHKRGAAMADRPRGGSARAEPIRLLLAGVEHLALVRFAMFARM